LNPAVLGVELLNEPFAGDIMRHPTLLGPGTADRDNLAPVYDALTAQLLEVAPDLVVFFAGLTWGRWGAGFTHAPANRSSHTAMAFHYYKPLDNLWLVGAQEQFSQNADDMTQLRTGGMVTEMFGPSCDASYSETAELAESYLQSYILWQYKLFCEESEESLRSVSQHAEFGACKTGGGCGFFDIDGTPKPGAFEGTARPYAMSVAGKLQYTRFKHKKFEMRFSVDGKAGATGHFKSFLFVSRKYTYPNGFRVTLTPPNVASYSNVPNRTNLLQIQVFPNVTAGVNVTVKIEPL